MKYVLVFLVVCVALVAAAPQFFTAWPYPGFAAPFTAPVARTVVAGPTVVNGFDSPFTAGFIETI